MESSVHKVKVGKHASIAMRLLITAYLSTVENMKSIRPQKVYKVSDNELGKGCRQFEKKLQLSWP